MHMCIIFYFILIFYELIGLLEIMYTCKGNRSSERKSLSSSWTVVWWRTRRNGRLLPSYFLILLFDKPSLAAKGCSRSFRRRPKSGNVKERAERPKRGLKTREGAPIPIRKKMERLGEQTDSLPPGQWFNRFHTLCSWFVYIGTLSCFETTRISLIFANENDTFVWK